MPGHAGGASAAQMTSANASSTCGLVAVSRQAAIASGAPPAMPLLTCSVTPHFDGGRDKRLDETRLLAGVEQSRRQPHRLVRAEYLPGLAEIGRPEHVAGRGAGTIVAEDHAGDLPQDSRIPETPARDGDDQRARH